MYLSVYRESIDCHAKTDVDQLYKQPSACHVTLSTGLALYRRPSKLKSKAASSSRDHVAQSQTNKRLAGHPFFRHLANCPRGLLRFIPKRYKRGLCFIGGVVRGNSKLGRDCGPPVYACCGRYKLPLQLLNSVCHFYQQAFCSLFTNTGKFYQRRYIPAFHATNELLRIKTRQNTGSHFGANTINLDQQTKQIPIKPRGKTKQALCIFTNHEMCMKGNLLPGFRQVIKRSERDVNFVTQAAAFNQCLTGCFFDQNTSDTTYQGLPPAAPQSSLLLSHTPTARLTRATGHPKNALIHVCVAQRDGQSIGCVSLRFARE